MHRNRRFGLFEGVSSIPRGQKMPNMSTVAKIVTYILGQIGSLTIFIIDREPLLLDL